MELRTIYAAFTLVLGLTSGAACADPGVEEYYRGVLAAMARLPQPPLVAYDVVARASGAAFYVTRDPGTGEAEFGFSVGSALGDTNDWWPVLVRTSDTTTSVRLNQTYAVTRFPALNATWGGIDSWMRFGMQEAQTPAPSPSPVAEASRDPNAPRVIAVVRSLGLSIYRVNDGGKATCDDGSSGRLLHLTAREDGSRHPATDVTVDAATDTICTIRFHIERSELVDRDGYVELHLAPVESYYLVKRGEISFTAGPRLGRQHIRVFLDYASVAFPRAVPPGAFAMPSPGRPI